MRGYEWEPVTVSQNPVNVDGNRHYGDGDVFNLPRDITKLCESRIMILNK